MSSDPRTPKFNRLYADAKRQILDEMHITYTEQQGQEPCKRCGGSGKYTGRNGQVFGKCYSCDGTGQKLGRVQVVIDGTVSDAVAVDLEAKADAARNARVSKRQNKRQAAEQAHPVLARFSAVELAAQGGDDAAVVVFEAIKDFAKDIASKGYKYGSLSIKQVSALENALDSAEEKGIQRYLQKAEAMAEQRAVEDNGAALDAPRGRVVVTGEVTGIKHYDNDFGEVTKMTVRSDDGYKVFVTVPRAIEEEVERGKRVSFKATLEPSPEDRKFAKGKRPCDAKVL